MRKENEERRKGGNSGGWPLTKVLGTCAIIFTLILSLIAIHSSNDLSLVLNRRSLTVDKIDNQSAQQLCFARLQGEFDSAIGDAALAPAGSPERDAAQKRLQRVNSRLQDIEKICYTDAPDVNPMTDEHEDPPTTRQQEGN